MFLSFPCLSTASCSTSLLRSHLFLLYHIVHLPLFSGTTFWMCGTTSLLSILFTRPRRWKGKRRMLAFFHMAMAHEFAVHRYRIRERKRCWPAQILQRFKQIYQFMPSLVIRPTVALESNENVSLHKLVMRVKWMSRKHPILQRQDSMRISRRQAFVIMIS